MHSSIQKLLCKLLVNHQHILLASQRPRSMQTIWTIRFFDINTVFTVAFCHILHHLNAGNQQKNLHPKCKLIVLIPHDISLQSWQSVFKTSVKSILLTRCLFATNCWIFSCWLHYVTGLHIPANPLAHGNLISVNSLE